jgi:lysylphosphatidylglycerol synthetase-like protein (DUF2156 family)
MLRQLRAQTRGGYGRRHAFVSRWLAAAPLRRRGRLKSAPAPGRDRYFLWTLQVHGLLLSERGPLRSRSRMLWQMTVSARSGRQGWALGDQYGDPTLGRILRHQAEYVCCAAQDQCHNAMKSQTLGPGAKSAGNCHYCKHAWPSTRPLCLALQCPPFTRALVRSQAASMHGYGSHSYCMRGDCILYVRLQYACVLYIAGTVCTVTVCAVTVCAVTVRVAIVRAVTACVVTVCMLPVRAVAVRAVTVCTVTVCIVTVRAVTVRAVTVCAVPACAVTVRAVMVYMFIISVVAARTVTVCTVTVRAVTVK